MLREDNWETSLVLTHIHTHTLAKQSVGPVLLGFSDGDMSCADDIDVYTSKLGGVPVGSVVALGADLKDSLILTCIIDLV